jgi:hypothetical protein
MSFSWKYESVWFKHSSTTSYIMIMARIGDVAYKLKLPLGAHIHDVFHVGLLKKYNGEPPSSAVKLPSIKHGRACLEPEKAIKCRLVRGRKEVLIQWKGHSVAEAGWMDL